MSLTPNLEQPPTFKEYFSDLVGQKKQQLHKASDHDAFEAAKQQVVQTFGFQPDFGFDAYRKGKNSQKKGKK
jgi:hypothetical protein